MTQPTTASFSFLPRYGWGLLLALPLVLLVNAIIWGAFSILTERQHQQWWLETEGGLDRILIHIEGMRNDLHGDLSLLASSANLKAVLDETTPENLDRLAAEWEVFTAIKRRYDQVRWLDNRGMERLRINRTPQGAHRVSDAQLQDKAGRYYFKEAISLPVGQIYASPIDLNIERGEVERPLKPMVRLAVPVTDSEGGRRGLLLVNVLAASILEDLSLHAGLSRSHLLLIDPAGYYVRGFREDQAWGFMLQRDGDDFRFDKAFPRIWQQMVKQGNGKADGAQGRFMFRSFSYGAEGFSQRYFLVLAALQAESTVLGQPQRSWWLLVSVLVSLILVVFSLMLSHYLSCCRRKTV